MMLVALEGELPRRLGDGLNPATHRRAPQPGIEIGDIADAVRDAALHSAVCDQRHGALAPSVE